MTNRNFSKEIFLITFYFMTVLYCTEAKETTNNIVGNKSDSILNFLPLHEISKLEIDYSVLSVSVSAFQSKSFESKNAFTLGLTEKFGLNIEYRGEAIDWKFNGKSELGFVYIVDSLWTKSNDYLELYLIGSEKRNKLFEISYSFLLISQVLPTYSYATAVDNTIRKNQVGGLLNPLVLQLAYGFDYKFNDIGRITGSLASLRLHSYKVNLDLDQERVQTKSIVTLDYGFSLVLQLKKKLFKHFEFSSDTHFFANSVNKDNIKCNSDFCIIYSLTQCIALQFTSRFNFDTSISNKSNYQNEILLSFCYKFVE